MFGQQWNIALAISQRRDEDRNDVQAEIQVLTKTAGANLGGQILVGCRQDPHVDLHARGAADRLDDLFLQRAQDLGLRLHAHVANLVEEERAAVRRFELSAPIRNGPGECSLEVSEQLAFNQLLGDRRTIYFNKRPGAASAQRMDAAGHEFLAGAVLSKNKDATVRRRRHRDLLAQLRHHIAFADHRQSLVNVGAQRAILRLQLPLSHRVADDEDGLFQRERLLDEIEGAHFDGADGGFDVPMARDHHHRRVHPALAEARQRCETIDAGEPDIQHDDVVGRAEYAIETRFAAIDRLDCIALVAEHAAQRAAHAGFIVNDKDGWFHSKLPAPRYQLPAACQVPAQLSCAEAGSRKLEAGSLNRHFHREYGARR